MPDLNPVLSRANRKGMEETLAEKIILINEINFSQLLLLDYTFRS